MLIDNVQINTTIVKRFSILNQKNRLAHAYLFSGPAYSGKSETALAIAQLINCENNEDGSLDNACQTCPACKKTMAGNHPDVHFFQTEYGETIKVETARAILESIQLRPFEARKKIFILRNAENLTLEGANALLKTLEEPSLNSLLILTTSQPEKILGTIRSRCHSVHFCSTSSETVKDQLEKLYDISADDSHFLSYFAEGCLGKAKNLNDMDFVQIKDEILDNFVLTRDSEAFLKTILADKTKTKILLDVLLSWTRDAILLKSGFDEKQLIHANRLRDLNHFVAQYTFTDLKDINDEIVKANKLLTDNLNIKVPLMIIKEKIWVS